MSRTKNRQLSRSIHRVLIGASILAVTGTASAQENLGEIVVTGTRITLPGVASSSPIYSVTAAEIDIQQQPEVEKIVRLLPISAPADSQNVNNGTDGASTVNLRGLGEQRNLVLIDGKRLVPYNHFGIVDTSMIPTALIQRIDIVTGGASAVYGSDAVSGALNFIMKKDFEGVEIESTYSQTSEEDGDVLNVNATMGGNFADGRGNMVVNLNYSDRKPVLLGARPLGLVGISTSDGFGLDEFLAGEGAAPPLAGCAGPNIIDPEAGGSPTSMPSTIGIAGSSSVGQIYDDRSLGAPCSSFNFNPYNYYQTPLERFGGAVLGHFEVSEHAEAYTRFNYGSTTVKQQIAPSGTFGAPFMTPLYNPFISADAQADILAAGNAGVANGTVLRATDPGGSDFFNWVDNNGDGAVDGGDELALTYFRRTAEFAPRSENYDNENWQLLLGTRGLIAGNWDYDVAFSYGETNRMLVRGGYTNVTNLGNALRTADGVTCENGDPTCVPIDLFGGFGSITPEMAAYSSATAFQQQTYEQLIVTGAVTGSWDNVKLPTADNPLAVSFGAEYRDESAFTNPDECLKLAPASCLGGAGGNILPIEGGYRVKELFAEAILPIANDITGVYGLDLELGYRYSDYNLSGEDDTWKVGLNYRPIEQLLFRVMQQKATRAPNVGELASPQTAGLDNATGDPCSVANAANIDAELAALCIATGMTAAQVGVVEDLAVGQINAFFGTDLNNLPDPEDAETFTAGVVWTPDFGDRFTNATFSLDYYDIEVDDWIGEFTPQEVLDGCYVLGTAEDCAKVQRVGGTLTLPGSGIQLSRPTSCTCRRRASSLGSRWALTSGTMGRSPSRARSTTT